MRELAVVLCLASEADHLMAAELLREAGIECRSVGDVRDLPAEVRGGAAVLVVDETRLNEQAAAALQAVLEEQPVWSDLPVILLRPRSGWQRGPTPLASSLGRSITVVERPVGSVALVSTIRTALQARARQYEVRDLLTHLQSLTATLEQRVEERTVELARSNEDLQQFASMASHDLQEPLHVVTLFLHLLGKRLAPVLDDEAREMIGHASGAADTMGRLIRDLLAYARAGSGGGERVSVDLNRAAETALQSLSAAVDEAGAKVRIDRLPTVVGNPTELTQVLQNLIANALKYSRPGVAPEVRVEAHPAEDEWVITVADNGIGIDPAHFGRIFLPFQRLPGHDEHSGSGIGLAIVKKTIERHGGRVWVESAPGSGARFHLSLPAAWPAVRPQGS